VVSVGGVGERRERREGGRGLIIQTVLQLYPGPD